MPNLNKQNCMCRYKKCTRPKLDYDVLMFRVLRVILTHVNCGNLCVCVCVCDSLGSTAPYRIRISIHGDMESLMHNCMHMAEHTSRECTKRCTTRALYIFTYEKEIRKIRPTAINEATTNALDFAQNWRNKKTSRVDGNIWPQPTDLLTLWNLHISVPSAFPNRMPKAVQPNRGHLSRNRTTAWKVGILRIRGKLHIIAYTFYRVVCTSDSMPLCKH